MAKPPREPGGTRVSVRGFHPHHSARDLAGILESVAAGKVLRCRVKTTCTPPGSYPDFQRPIPAPAAAAPVPYYGRVPPHAFVHFADPRAAGRAARWSGLHVCRSGTRRRSVHGSFLRGDTKRPFLFPGSRVEVGELVVPGNGNFAAAWRGTNDVSASASGLDVVAVDPSDGRCRVLLARDAAFVLPVPASVGEPAAEVLRCDLKLEFAIGDIAEVRAFQDEPHRLSLLLRLSAPPLVYYRTAADDEWCHPSAPLDLLADNDDDPWIRTTDIATPSGVIRRCEVYRISFGAWFRSTMIDMLAFIKGQRVPVEYCTGGGCQELTVITEPNSGQPKKHAEWLRFPVLYLVKALMLNGIVNQHQLTADFFGLLKTECDAVNVAALTELLGGKCQVSDVCPRLKNAQDNFARNPKLLHLLSSRKVSLRFHRAS